MNNMYDGCKISVVGQYPAIYRPSHKRANTSGMVYVHILQAEKILHRPLRDSEVVHHVDFDKSNYATDNLMIFADAANHTRYHNALKTNSNYVLINQKNVFYCIYGEFLLNKVMSVYGLQGNVPAQMRSICPICGGWMSTHAKACSSCHNKNKALNSSRPSMQVLIDELLKYKSFSKVGTLHNVSEAAVRKWCKFYNLPYRISEWK